MICKKCGNQLNDSARFCPKCGQKTDDQTPNTSNINPVNNISGEGTHKKKHTLRTVLLSVAATIIVLFGGLFWIGSQAPSSVETGSSSVSVSSEQNEVESDVPSQDIETSNVSSPEAIKELLGYIDQAEALLTKAYSDIEAYSIEEYGAEKFGLTANVLGELLPDLSELQKQANSVSGIDTKLATAAKEYFNMACDSRNAYFEMMVFITDYFELYDILSGRPKTEDYTSIGEYYNTLAMWLESVKERYLAINSCPSCLESEWKQYGDILDLNGSVLDKIYQAYSYNDFLRWNSAGYMSNRYNTIEELQYNAFLDCLKGESAHAQLQRESYSKLADEIHAYAELEEKERSGYEFEYVRTNKIVLNYEAIDTIYPSLYNTYDAFLIFKTGCVSGTRKILVEAEIPGFTQVYKESFALDSAYRAIYIKPPALTGDLDLSSVKDAQIKVTISEQDGTLIDAKTFPVTIQSKFDVDWYTDEYGIATQDNILCFLTPESSAISDLKRRAIEEISSMTNKQMESFVGYQETRWGHYVGTYLQAAGIMRALYEMGVRYNADSFSLSSGHQHVLLPEDVLNQRSGLCIETSLVVASALQSAGMHAFLVFPPGHAQVAVEIWNGRGEDTSGTGEYFLIETTALSSAQNNQSIFVENANALLDGQALNSSPITYKNAEEWSSYLSGVEYLIDCDDSRVLGLTPFAN